MNKNVYDLAQEDTSLKRVSYKEYAGPCPLCSGVDRFHVQPGRKDNGAWFCRGCYPAEQKGWGDDIAYLMHIRGMSYPQAKNELNGEIDSLLEQVGNYQSSKKLLPDDEQLQNRYQMYIREAIQKLWTPEGKPCLDYLLSRGLNEDFIQKLQLGCIDSQTLRSKYLARVEADTQFIVIPWYADGKLWRVQLRDIRPGVPVRERYRNFPKSGDSLYLGDYLKQKRVTFLVEDEFSAMSIAQESYDLPVNVVATGSTDRGRSAKWESRLARMPGVLVALDNDQDGERASKEWLKVFIGVTTAKRYRPLLKDINDMHKRGYDIRSFVTAALDYLNGSPETIEVDPLSICSLPGCSEEVYTFIGDDNEGIGKPYCETHSQSLQQQPEQEPLTSKEQFQAIVKQLADVIPGEVEIHIEHKGTYTIKDHVREIEEQRRQAERDMWQYRRKVRAS